MARLYLIRHGEPSGTWTDAADPGLSPLGHEQAKAVAEKLKAFGALDVVSSPLRRAHETSAPYAAMREVQPTISHAVAEIPTPPGVLFETRGDWLRSVMTGNWSDTPSSLQGWRTQVVDYLKRLSRDTAIFSHYVAINVAVGAARRADNVIVFAPLHTSITIIDASLRALEEIELGAQGQSIVR